MTAKRRESFPPIVIPGRTPDGKPAFEPISVESFALALRGSLGKLPHEARREATRGPEKAWRLVLPRDASGGQAPGEIEKKLQNLTRLHNAEPPLVYDPPEEAHARDAARAWFHEQREALWEKEQTLVLAGPVTQLPFALQQYLSQYHHVGRLTFSLLDDYAVYAEKACAAADHVAASRNTLFFAPDFDDATHFSQEMLVKPFARHLTSRGVGGNISSLLGAEARHETLLNELVADGDSAPSLMMLASHGLNPYDHEDPTVGSPLDQVERPLTGKEVLDAPAILNRGVAVLFACNSAGRAGDRAQPPVAGYDRIPAGAPDVMAEVPMAMLAHPRGPLALVAHVDPICGWGLQDLYGHLPEGDEAAGIVPMRNLLRALAAGDPLGMALWPFKSNVIFRHDWLASLMETPLRRGDQIVSDDDFKLVKAWIAWNDANGWVVLGDPAVRAGGSGRGNEHQVVWRNG